MKKILTASVIVMGLLILAGLAALVIGILNKAGEPDSLGDAARADPANAIVMRLGLPDETTVRRLQSVDQGLAVHLTIPGKGDWIYVVPLSGRGSVVKIAVSAKE